MDDCSICLDELKNNKVVLNCKHSFHLECLLKLEKRNCPLCREEIINKELCKENHTTFFCNSYFNKKGKCIICKKMSFKSYLKKNIVNKI